MAKIDRPILLEIVRVVQTQSRVPEYISIQKRRFSITYLEDHSKRIEEALRRQDAGQLNMLFGQLESKVKYQLLKGSFKEPAPAAPAKAATPAKATRAAKTARPAKRSAARAAAKPKAATAPAARTPKKSAAKKRPTPASARAARSPSRAASATKSRKLPQQSRAKKAKSSRGR